MKNSKKYSYKLTDNIFSKDSLGNYQNPDLYVFQGQTEEEAADLLKLENIKNDNIAQIYKFNKKELKQPNKGLVDTQTDHKRYDCLIDIRKEPKNTETDCFDNCIWRKLAGITNEERLDFECKNELEEEILSQIKEEFECANKFEWYGDCFDKTLLINGCKSKFKLSMLYETRKAILSFADSKTANRAIASIIIDKMKEVFA